MLTVANDINVNALLKQLTRNETNPAGCHHGPGGVQGREGDEEEDGESGNVKGLEHEDNGNGLDSRSPGPNVIKLFCP